MSTPATPSRTAARDPAPVPFDLPDPEVVERIRAGESALFEILVRRYNRRLFRAAWSILLDEEEAEDVIQDAYVRAFRNLHRFEGRAALSTWLTRIAVHEASARRRKRRRQVSLEAIEPAARERVVAAAVEPPASAEDRAHRRELRAVLLRAIAALPGEYRQVFVLREVERLSHREIARALGVSVAASKVRHFRAKRRLRRELERLTGGAVGELLPFAGVRCDRVVAGVMGRIRAA
ncbi:MAG TPA: RNA polymerase sigma factor [Thermoanaerobaculia bacterium]|nr:RNA polymerase sigma factor [Thermoanaerobaculia bacterium]